MVVQHGIVGTQFNGTLQPTGRFLEVAHPIMRPAETVDDVAVFRLELDGFFDQLQPGFQVFVLVHPGVTEVVQHRRLIGTELQCRLQIGFGCRPFVHALIGRAARIIIIPVPRVRFLDDGDGAGVIADRFVPAFLAPHDRPKRVERLQVIGLAVGDLLQQRLGFLDAVERIEVERFADIDGGFQRGAGRDLLVDFDGASVIFGALVNIGERGQGERKARLQVQRILQEHGTGTNPALAGQRFAQAEQRFR